jgi:hypothetical protein
VAAHHQLSAVPGEDPERDLFEDVIVDIIEDGEYHRRFVVTATMCERWAKTLQRAAKQARHNQKAACARRMGRR